MPVLPGACAELVDVISDTLLSGHPTRILVSHKDHYVLRDLQAMGGEFIGYMFESSEAPERQGWNGKGRTTFVPIIDVDSHLLSGERIVQAVVTFRKIVLDPTFGSKEYLRFCKSRERYFIGLSEINYESEKLVTSSRPPELTSRWSSTVLGPLAPTRKMVESVLKRSFMMRTNGSLPYATAGGIDNLTVTGIFERSDCADGIYEIKNDGSPWRLLQPGQFSKAIIKGGFSQPAFDHCSVFLAVVANVGACARKYGNRAYRFSFLNAGGFLQAAQVACAELGVGCRILGGFDDAALESVLGIESEGHVLVALLGLGCEP